MLFVKTRGAKVVIGLLLIIGLLFPVIANAVVFKIGGLQGTVNIYGPVIWYNETGTPEIVTGKPRIDVSFSLYRQRANVTGSDYNWALHIYDHSSTEGIVVYKSVTLDKSNNEKLNRAKTSLIFFGVNITKDPSDAGLVITEIQLDGNSSTRNCTAFFSFYYYKNNTLVPSYDIADTTSGYTVIESDKGNHIQINGWDQHQARIIFRYNNNKNATVIWKLDRKTVYKLKNFPIGNLCTGLRKKYVTTISFNTGLFDTGTEYDMFIDNVSLKIKTSTGENDISRSQFFGDGTDDLFDRTYTFLNGSIIVPLDNPRDIKVGAYIEYALSHPVLAVETNLQNNTLTQSRLELSNGYCYSDYNSRSTPIEVENLENTYLDSITVIVNLSSKNFMGWSKISPGGSDIYVTDDKGQPLYYWIEYLNKTQKKALILVNVTDLPAYSKKTIYLHYGGSNPYPSYRDPNKVYLLFDDFNYTGLNDMASSGDWKIVNSSAVINVSNSNIYIITGNNIYAVRTTKKFYEPLTIDYSLWACSNNSDDWDAGIALGKRKRRTVMFVDDMNVPGGSIHNRHPDYLAIAHYKWSGDIDKLPNIDARRDLNWLIPHIYRVDVNSSLFVWFNDTSDGRWNNNESINNFANNPLPGYIWLINDGDKSSNCAIYGWIAVLPYSVSSQEIYRVHVMEDAEPLIVEYMENATSTGWNHNPVYASGYNTHSIGSVTDLLDLVVVNNVSPGNLSHIYVFTSQPAGARTGCFLRTVNPYYLNPSSISPLIVFLEHEIRMDARN